MYPLLLCMHSQCLRKLVAKLCSQHLIDIHSTLWGCRSRGSPSMLPSTICPSSSSCPLHLHHFRLLLVNRLQAFLRAPKRNFLRHFAVYVSMKIQQDTCCASRLSLLASRHWRAPLRELSRKENGASPSGACCKRSQG